MSSLVVLLPTQPATAATEFDYVLTADGRHAQSHASAPAALLPRTSGAGAEVVAIAPASALSWHQVELPKGTSAGSPRLRAVLEGVLEDRLLDEPEHLHFAVQPQARAGSPVWVAVCDRAWLRSCVQVLEGAQRPAARIVPEFAPGGAPAVYAVGEGEGALLVAVGPDGVTTLPLAPGAPAMLPALDDDAPRYAEPAAAAQAEQVLQHKVQLLQAPQRWLWASQAAWDLAQFDLASSGRARTFKKLAGGWAQLLRAPQWRAARWGAALLVVLNLAGLNAWAWQERSALEAKREAVRRALTTTFPNVKVVVDAPLQMEKEVALLRQAVGASSGRDLEAMLNALAAVAPQRTVSGLEFNGSELRIRGLGAGTDEARALATNLKSLGYAATPQGDVLVLAQESAR
jgi:general secretion pathway protein L